MALCKTGSSGGEQAFYVIGRKASGGGVIDSETGDAHTCAMDCGAQNSSSFKPPLIQWAWI